MLRHLFDKYPVKEHGGVRRINMAWGVIFEQVERPFGVPDNIRISLIQMLRYPDNLIRNLSWREATLHGEWCWLSSMRT